MASIITATTTSGLTQSADNSGVLQLASGTGNLVTVPSVTGTAMVSGNMPAFSAYANTNQSISSATFTKVTFGTENFDTNNNFASSRFTPTVAGYYQINAGTRNSVTGSVTNAVISIYKNGSNYRRGGENSSTVGNNQTIVSEIVYCNGTTDYLEIYAYIQGTSPFLESVGADITSYFSGCLMRAA
jgi:hypothetical protein